MFANNLGSNLKTEQIEKWGMLQNLWMVEPSLDVPLTSWWLSLGWEPASNQVQGEPKISDQLEKFTKNLFIVGEYFLDCF